MNDKLKSNTKVGLVIAGVASNTGKTTIAIGLAIALRRLNYKVAMFKCGPDYLDPSYHQRASGQASHNLDGWMMGREGVLATYNKHSEEADIVIVEGVMGLYDGASSTEIEGSTAQIANWLNLPVVLAMDVSGTARTAAAMVQGLQQFDDAPRFAGVIANRVGSDNHCNIIQEACQAINISVLGGIPKHDLTLPARHLGLLTASQDKIEQSLLEQIGDLIAAHIDLPLLLRQCSISTHEISKAESKPNINNNAIKVKIGYALDEAFHFYYPYNLELLEQNGAELIAFSPLHDTEIPPVDLLLLGGGYPEVYAQQLAENTSMLEAIRQHAQAGMPIYAECGGWMYLTKGIHTAENRHTWVGLFDAEISLYTRLQALGYVTVTLSQDTILGEAGMSFKGHEFRYSDAKLSKTTQQQCAYQVVKKRNQQIWQSGYYQYNVVASYIHAHWASAPEIAKNLVNAAREYQRLF